MRRLSVLAIRLDCCDLRPSLGALARLLAQPLAYLETL
jgi:hypothetical protein